MKTKIVPVNYIDSLEKKSIEEKNSTYIGIEEMNITYTQPADTNSSSDDIQVIKITSRTAACSDFNNVENQDGHYFDVTIPEGHWSIEDGDEIKALIDDFKQRLYLVTEHGDTGNS